MLGLKPNRFAAVQNKVKAEAWAKVKCVALIDGETVLSTHKTHTDGNVALCKGLDAKEAANVLMGHKLDLIPLSYIPTIGEKVDRRNTVWLP